MTKQWYNEEHYGCSKGSCSEDDFDSCPANSSKIDRIIYWILRNPFLLPDKCHCDTGNSFFYGGRCQACGHADPHTDGWGNYKSGYCPHPTTRNMDAKEVKAEILKYLYEHK